MIGNKIDETFKSKKARYSDFKEVDHTDIYGNNVRIKGASINDYWDRYSRCKQIYDVCANVIAFTESIGQIEITKTEHSVNIKTSRLGTVHSYALDFDEWGIFEQNFLGKITAIIEEESCQ